MTTRTLPVDIPAHVPRELVMSFPLRLGAVTYDNPYDTIIPDVHKMPPVFWAPDAWSGIAPAWVFRRAEDLNRIFLDTEHFSSRDVAAFSTLLGENWLMLPLEADPPHHAKYRALLTPLLTPKRVAMMNNRVREHARTYIDRFKHNNGCEFISEFAARFPIAVFLEVFGLSIDGVEQFLAWEDDLMHNPDMDKKADSVRAVKKYLMSVVDERRDDPRDDLISLFTHAQIDGYPATSDEIWGLCFTLYTGGLDTVTNSLGWHFRHLATHPEQQETLRKNPAMIPDAIEEFLRAFSVATITRTCIKPVTVSGVRLEAGDKVMVSTPLGSTDPEAYDKPSEVILDRKPRHMAFGSGIHNCVGLRLARRELHIALEEILTTLPPFRLAPDARILSSLGGVISQKSLPLVW